MSKGTLDAFLGTKAPPEILYPEENCCVCGKNLHGKDQFKITEKGKVKLYCKEDYKQKMKPLENAESLQRASARAYLF